MTTEKKLERAEEIIVATKKIIELSCEFHQYELIVEKLERDVAPLIDKYRADLIRDKQTVDGLEPEEKKMNPIG